MVSALNSSTGFASSPVSGAVPNISDLILSGSTVSAFVFLVTSSGGRTSGTSVSCIVTMNDSSVNNPARSVALIGRAACSERAASPL